jgi:serine/threonine protein kinase
LRDKSFAQHFSALEDNPALLFLKQAMLAMQRRSGVMTSTPDAFVITSLEVVIHRDRKIGEGGFGQVFEAQWQGSRVAVKVLNKGVPSIVSG